MPVVDTRIAGLALPIVPGAPDAPIVDPTVAGLLDYLGFWLQQMLNPVLAVMTAPPVLDACPAANRYPVNPSSLVARFSRPALFLWWDGLGVVTSWTTMKDVRTRKLQSLYVFDRVGSDTTAGQDARIRYAGLIAAVDATFLRAIARRSHPAYQAPGFQIGTPIAVSLGLNALDYLGGQEGFLQEVPTASARAAAVQTGAPKLSRGNTQGILQGYPCLRGTFRVVEECGADTPVLGDVDPGILFQPQLGGDPTNPFPLDARYLPTADERTRDGEP